MIYAIYLQVDSAFHLKKPHDLIGLMQQETRMEAITDLERELMEEKVKQTDVRFFRKLSSAF
jgi:hypothetical protein